MEPIPYAGIATGRDAVLEGSVLRAILLGGTLLRLIGAYSLVECREAVTRTGANAIDFATFDFALWSTFAVIAAYFAWGILLLIRGPRLMSFVMRPAARRSMAEGAEWSVVALCAAGAIVILWTMPPLLGAAPDSWTVVPPLAQLALGVWLFLAAGRLASVEPRVVGRKRES